MYSFRGISWLCGISPWMTNSGLQLYPITKWWRRGKLKTYYEFNVFISVSSTSYKTFCLSFSCFLIWFPSCPACPETLLHYLFYHGHVLFSITPQHSTSLHWHCPQNAMTHHQTPLSLKISRAGMQGSVRGVQKKAVARVNPLVVAGLFCSICAFWYSCFLQELSPLKEKKSNKARGSLSQSHCANVTFTRRSVHPV